MEPEKVDLIKELGLEDLPEEQKDTLVSGLAQSLQSRISVRVMELLSESERQELEQLTAAGDDQKIGEYINSKVPGLDDITKQEIMRLRDEVVSANQRAQEALKNRASGDGNHQN